MFDRVCGPFKGFTMDFKVGQRKNIFNNYSWACPISPFSLSLSTFMVFSNPPTTPLSPLFFLKSASNCSSRKKRTRSEERGKRIERGWGEMYVPCYLLSAGYVMKCRCNACSADLLFFHSTPNNRHSSTLPIESKLNWCTSTHNIQLFLPLQISGKQR